MSPRYNPQATAAALERLFRTYPSFGHATDGSPADRVEMVKVYFEALEPYETHDIEAAVQSFLSGSAPGHNPAFAPAAPQVAAETRRIMNLRLDAERRERLLRPQLPPPDIQHSPESQVRVAARAAAAVASLASDMRTPDAEAARRREAMAKVHARFDPPQDEDAMRQRLGFTTGSPESERAAS